MNHLFDALLPRPLPAVVYHPLEFLFFVIHFFFVLITMGAAFFAVLAIYRRMRGRGEDLPPDPEHGRTQSSSPVYFASKSLMITFGIAVLLLVMAFYSVPFTGAANLNGGVWMAIIVILSAALIVLEVFDRRSKGPARRAALWTGIAGLALLMIVPAIFVAFVVTAENPGRWAEFFSRNVVFTSLAGHWFVRLLHVYGAAVVIAGMFYLIYSSRTGKRSPVTADVLFGALMIQIVLGILLYMSMPSRPSALMNVFVMIGAGAAAGFAREMFSGRAQKGGRYLLPASLALILIPMLLARQINQENVLVPFRAQLERNAAAYRASVKKFAPAGGNPYFTEKYDAYNLPQFIFQRGCAFCHGGVGNGQGPEAGNLLIRPADLTRVRTNPRSLQRLLEQGVPGTAMPYFSIYTADALKGLVNYLYEQVGIRTSLEPVQVPTSDADRQTAASIFSRQCAECHGKDGKVSKAGKLLKPPPRDLSQWSYEPGITFTVISKGIPGTVMSRYELPEGVIWALVQYVNSLYVEKKR